MSDDASIDRRDRPSAQAVALDAATVRVLARVAGYASLDEATIERMAAGAASAVRAVRASVGASLMDLEPGQFAAELERLAAER